MLAKVPKCTVEVPKITCSDAGESTQIIAKVPKNDIFDGHNPPVPITGPDAARYGVDPDGDGAIAGVSALKITPCKTCAGAVNTVFVDHAVLVVLHPGSADKLIVAAPAGGAVPAVAGSGGAAASQIGVVDVVATGSRDAVTGLVSSSGALPLGAVTEVVVGLAARAIGGGGLSAEVYFTVNGTGGGGNNCVYNLTLDFAGAAAAGSAAVFAGSCAVAGAADAALAASARFNAPTGLAMSDDGAALYLFVADTGNHAVRRVTLATGAVTTVAGTAGEAGDSDGNVTTARLRGPTAVAVGTKAGAAALFVAEKAAGRVRWIDISTGTGAVAALVGGGGSYAAGQHADGGSTSAKLRAPSALAARGDLVYVADEGSIRVIDAGAGYTGSTAGSTLRTVAGANASAAADVLDGIGGNARFLGLTGACVSADGLWVFAADAGDSVAPFVAGSTWSREPSRRPRLRRVAVGAAVLRPPTLPAFVLRKTETLTLSLSSAPGGGSGGVVVTPTTPAGQPSGATFDPPSIAFGESDTSASFNVTATSLGGVSIAYALSGGGAAARAVAAHEGGSLDVAAVTKSTVAMPAALSSSFTADDDTVVTVELSSPPGNQLTVQFTALPAGRVEFDPATLSFAPGETKKDVTVSASVVGAVAVTMVLTGTSASDFEGPQGSPHASLTVVPPQTVGATLTLAGPSTLSSGGAGGGGGNSSSSSVDAAVGSEARFASSGAAALSSSGATLFVIDIDAAAVTRVRVVNTTTGATSTAFTDSSEPAALSGQIFGAALSTSGDTLYLSDYASHTIRAMAVPANVTAGGALTLNPVAVAGVSGSAGFANGAKGVGKMNGPMGIAVASVGGADAVFVADSGNRAVRVVTASTGVIATVAGNGNDTDVRSEHSPVDGAPRPAGDARYLRPVAIAVTPNASKAYVVDADARQVSRITAAAGAGAQGIAAQGAVSEAIIGRTGGALSQVQGWFNENGYGGDQFGTEAGLVEPAAAVCLGGGGDVLYVADKHALRAIELSTGRLSTFAGQVAVGSATALDETDAVGDQARFFNVSGVAGTYAGAGFLFVTDAVGRVRRVQIPAKALQVPRFLPLKFGIPSPNHTITLSSPPSSAALTVVPTMFGVTFTPSALSFAAAATSAVVSLNQTVGTGEQAYAAQTISFVLSGDEAGDYHHFASQGATTTTNAGATTTTTSGSLDQVQLGVAGMGITSGALPTDTPVGGTSANATQTLTLDAATPSDLTVTPASPGATFSPAAMVFAAGDAAKTFTFTGSSSGAHALTWTLSGTAKDIFRVEGLPASLTVGGCNTCPGGVQLVAGACECVEVNSACTPESLEVGLLEAGVFVKASCSSGSSDNEQAAGIRFFHPHAMAVGSSPGTAAHVYHTSSNASTHHNVLSRVKLATAVARVQLDFLGFSRNGVDDRPFVGRHLPEVRLMQPAGVFARGGGNGGVLPYLYFVDKAANCIRKFREDKFECVSECDTNLLSHVELVAGQCGAADGVPNGTFAWGDGTGAAARMNAPWALTGIESSDVLFFTEADRVRSLNVTSNVTTTVAGLAGSPGSADGVGAAARFNLSAGNDVPSGALALSPDGTTLFVADTGNHCVRAVNTATGAVTTAAGVCGASGSGDGHGAADDVRFEKPRALALNAAGTVLYVGDVRKVRAVALGGGGGGGGGGVGPFPAAAVAGGAATGVQDVGVNGGGGARFFGVTALALSAGGGGALYVFDASMRLRQLAVAAQAVAVSALVPLNIGSGPLNATFALSSPAPVGGLTVTPTAPGLLFNPPGVVFLEGNTTGWTSYTNAAVSPITDVDVEFTVTKTSAGNTSTAAAFAAYAMTYSALKVTLTLPTFAQTSYRVGKTETVNMTLSAPLTNDVTFVIMLENTAEGNDAMVAYTDQAPGATVVQINGNSYSGVIIPAGNTSTTFGLVTFGLGNSPVKRYRYLVRSDSAAAIEGLALLTEGMFFVDPGSDHYTTAENTITWEVCQTCAGATQTAVGVNGNASHPRDTLSANSQQLPLLKQPTGVAAYVQLGSNKTALVFADTNASAVRRADTATGTVETLTHLVRSENGELLNLSDSGYSDGCVSGSTSRAKLNKPQGVAVSADGRTVYVADTDNHVIRKIIVSSGDVSAGRRRANRRIARHRHAARRALLMTEEEEEEEEEEGRHGQLQPQSRKGRGLLQGGQIVMADAADADRASNCPTAPYVATLAGNRENSATFKVTNRPAFADGAAAVAMFDTPQGLVLSSDGATLFVADSNNHRVRAVNTSTGAVTTLAGGETIKSLYRHADGVGDAARFYQPRALALSADGARMFVAEYGNAVVRRVLVATGEVTTVAGEPGDPDTSGVTAKDGSTGAGTEGDFGMARFSGPAGVAVGGGDTENTELVYVSDIHAHTLRVVSPAARAVMTVAGQAQDEGAAEGDAIGGNARFSEPQGVVVDPAPVVADVPAVFVASSARAVIRRVVVADTLLLLPDPPQALRLGSTSTPLTLRLHGALPAGAANYLTVALSPGGASRVENSLGTEYEVCENGMVSFDPASVTFTPSGATSATFTATGHAPDFSGHVKCLWTAMVTSGGGAPPTGVAVYRFADNSNPLVQTDHPHFRSGRVEVLKKALILPVLPSTLVALQDSDALEVYAPAEDDFGNDIEVDITFILNPSWSQTPVDAVVTPSRLEFDEKVTAKTFVVNSRSAGWFKLNYQISGQHVDVYDQPEAQELTVYSVVTPPLLPEGLELGLESEELRFTSAVPAAMDQPVTILIEAFGVQAPPSVVIPGGSQTSEAFTVSGYLAGQEVHFLFTVMPGEQEFPNAWSGNLLPSSMTFSECSAARASECLRRVSTLVKIQDASSPVAGATNGAADSASFYFTQGHALRLFDGKTSTFSSVAGGEGNEQGFVDGADGASSLFNNPAGVVAAAATGASHLFVADAGNNAVRRVTLATGATVTVAGSASGRSGLRDAAAGAGALFKSPTGVAVTADSAALFVADTGNGAVRRVDLRTTAVTTVDVAAALERPVAVAASADGTVLFIADGGGEQGGARRVVRVDLSLARNAAGREMVVGGAHASAAGDPEAESLLPRDGFGGDALFVDPAAVACNADGTLAVVVDKAAHTLRVLAVAGGGVVARTLAGAHGQAGTTDGIGASGRFQAPASVTMPLRGGVAFVADAVRLKSVSVGHAALVPPALPSPVAVGASGAAQRGLLLRLTSPPVVNVTVTLTVDWIAGVVITPAQQAALDALEDGLADVDVTFTPATLVFAPGETEAQFNFTVNRLRTGAFSMRYTVGGADTAQYMHAPAVDSIDRVAVLPASIAVSPAALSLVAGDPVGSGATVVTVTAGAAVVEALTVTPTLALHASSEALGMKPDALPTFFPASATIAPGQTSVDFLVSAHQVFEDAPTLTYALSGADNAFGRFTAAGAPATSVRVLACATCPGAVLNVASAWTAGTAAFTALALTADGAWAYFADAGAHGVGRLDVATGALTRVAGATTGFAAADAADADASVVVVVVEEEAVTHRDAFGTSARFNAPTGLALIEASGTLLVADTANHCLRSVATATGLTFTVAGFPGESGMTDGVGTFARFHSPAGLALNPNNTVVFVADTANNAVRAMTISTSEVVTLVAQSAGLVRPASIAAAPAGDVLYVAAAAQTLLPGDALGPSAPRLAQVTVSTGGAVQVEFSLPIA
jgi:sugar lactone lactonase YvrE